MIRDMNGTLQLKLWNDHSEAIQEQDEGAKLTLRNVEVDIYQNQAQLKTIEISQIVVSITGLSSVFGSVALNCAANIFHSRK